MEKHFDAWSEFYKSLNLMGYRYVQMNIMEPAGKDVRLDELADIASHAKNEGVRTVLELSTGYMKEISRATLNEKDYILIYKIFRKKSLLPITPFEPKSVVSNTKSFSITKLLSPFICIYYHLTDQKNRKNKKNAGRKMT